jgi:hypothetical protein
VTAATKPLNSHTVLSPMFFRSIKTFVKGSLLFKLQKLASGVKKQKKGLCFGKGAHYQKVSIQALHCGKVNVPIRPLLPPHLRRQGAYRYTHVSTSTGIL